MVVALTLLAPGVLLVSNCAVRPRSDSSPVQDRHNTANVQPAIRININSAGTEELERLPGVGKVIAERIVEHRAQHGRFRRAEHLLMVRGVSDRRFRELQPLIVVK